MATTYVTATELITGNTFPHKDELKVMGGRWDAARKGWSVPAARAADARALVAGAHAVPRAAHPAYQAPIRRCIVCGHMERRDARGYPIGDRILRSGECTSCYEERKMGY